MKRAALVLATSVALFICAVGNANAATRKYVSMPSNGSVVGSGSAAKSGESLIITGQPLDGEYIPSSYGGGSKGTKLPIKPKYDYSIPRTLKGMTGTLRGGVVGIGLTLGLDWMLDQVGGFIDENGQAMKRSGQTVDGMPSQPSSYSTAGAVCQLMPYSQTFGVVHTITATDGAIYAVTVANNELSGVAPFLPSSYTLVSHCTNKTLGYKSINGFFPVVGARLISDPATEIVSGGSVPLTDADFDIMEAAAAAQDSEWLKDRLREHCEGSLAPESCYEDLRTSTHLEGPSAVTEKGPTTNTTGPGGTTITTNNTKIDITYGDNYYDYRKTSTVTKTNPDATTETGTTTAPEEVTEEQEEQQEEMPEVTDLYKPYIDKLETIKTDVAAPPGVTSPIGYSSWYSFGGGCSEIHAQLPVIGSWSTNYCPLINDWVRPVLAFIFVMFTWHYCRSLWSEAVTKARPM